MTGLETQETMGESQITLDEPDVDPSQQSPIGESQLTLDKEPMAEVDADGCTASFGTWPGGTTLVDARNGFNELSRFAMLWKVRHRWPTGARFIFNCYRHWALLVV
eukprot:12605519-Ditylum_brightwellii.AAC.1